MDLVLLWVFILAFAVYAYVVLDGFDLGIGLLAPFVGSSADRERMIGAIAPVWDGNETWLVLGGGGLMAAFPLAYAILMPALYAPLVAMLLALIFRGVAFEFRHRDERHRSLWTAGFVFGSYVATFCQGIALGTILQGVETSGRAYAGGWFDWLSPFSLATGAALLAGYALLGACFLLMKTGGDLQDRMFRYARPLSLLLVAFVGLVSLWTPLISDFVAGRWFTWPNIALLSPVPLLVLGIAAALLRSLARRHEFAPFLLTLALFFLCFLGLGISFFPYIVPISVTVWQAAAPASTLVFLLVGVAILIPIILIYTGYSYWVFRGKVEDQQFYH
ncbi:cytochrome d ubiquinol oxidase subunit II [Propylenella binzhouense]|uniref:Cytochrome d ubiquinol oxidase subunit II n=1 Tax=Propylenella binzhouense TaxID=2555902 RepID=A0A964WV16_9HYPH|nr:cytochrome d ubiquinol oxidase subunit II [Propylenella binzhouense]MYZ49732.1 cytochrome d ubiquinol oxidase subunit II [Propylenella binzhouense]